MQIMKLNLDIKIIETHIQKYAHSCVPMGIELVLKLMGQVNVDYYELQNEKENVSRGGEHFDKRVIQGTQIKMEFDIQRGPEFPLVNLFNRIYQELNAGRFVNCAWRSNASADFHAFVIYGYGDDEFLAVTKNHNESDAEFISDMKTRLTNIQGSDILTFNRV